MYSIGLATSADVPLLPSIESRACALFLAHPLTADLPDCPTALDSFERGRLAGLLWVARTTDGRPVGFALAERLGADVHIEELDVLPEHGRQGLGAALVRAVCEYARAAGRDVTLCTFAEIPWNAPFYERLGFRRLSGSELTHELRERTRDEAARGLRPDLRVAMRWTRA